MVDGYDVRGTYLVLFGKTEVDREKFIASVEEFIKLGGPTLWANLHDESFVIEWSIFNRIDYTHPVTGNTIFHENPQLLEYIKTDKSILHQTNFYGNVIQFD